MRRHALRDDQWDRIKDILPGREGHAGGTVADNRLFVEAVLFRFRVGIPWRDLPERQIQPKTPRPCDFALYCERNLIERFFNKLKHFRAIATRYDKLA